MGNGKNDQDQEKGFVIKDKRFSARKEGSEESKPAGEKRVEETPEEGEVPLPEINFANFLFSLSTSALIQLGEIPDPLSQKPGKNLALAKQTIDLIGLMKEKTKGNLTPPEEKLVESLLYDLRMRYVKAAG